MPNLRKFYLYGGLADKFSTEPLELISETPEETLLALRSIFPEWRAYLHKHPELVFVVSDDYRQNPRAVEADFISGRYGDATEVHILPAHEGELMAIPFIAAAVGESVVAALVVNAISSMLISMALGAITQALAPSAQTGAGSRNQVAEKQSFLFNGAVNVQQQGGPVPLIFGYFMSGSTVASSAVDVEQLLTMPAQSEAPSNGSGVSQPLSPPVTPWQWAGV